MNNRPEQIEESAASDADEDAPKKGWFSRAFGRPEEEGESAESDAVAPDVADDAEAEQPTGAGSRTPFKQRWGPPSSPALEAALAYVRENPHRVDEDELTEILRVGQPDDIGDVPFDQLCALVAGPAEVSGEYQSIVVHEEAVEEQPEALVFSDHEWPVKFSRRNGEVPQVEVHSVPRGAIGLSPRREVVMDASGRVVPEVSGAPHLAPLYRGAEVERLEGRLLVVGTPGARMFSHWIFDVLPRIDAARQAGYDLEAIDHVLVQGRPNSFTEESLEALGFGPDQIIYGRNRLPLYQADELIVPTAVRRTKYTPAWVRGFVRELFMGAAATEVPEPTRKVVYLSRQEADRRRIAGHELLDEFLAETEAVTLLPENVTVAEAARELSDAALIIGPHGAGMANAVFMPPWSAGIEIVGTHFMPEYFQLISTTTSKYVLLTGDDEEGLDVFDPVSLDAHRRLSRKDTRWADINLNPTRTSQALKWARAHLDGLAS